jgi:uncharacterized RDD family membrane protein YckC
MKCPQCSIFLSDYRDTCTRCGLDLAPYKDKFRIETKSQNNPTTRTKSPWPPTIKDEREDTNFSQHKHQKELDQSFFDDLTEEISDNEIIPKTEIKKEEIIIAETTPITKLESKGIAHMTNHNSLETPLIPSLLWEQTIIDLKTAELRLESDIEVGLGQLCDFIIDPRLDILFIAADEEILDPTKCNRRDSISNSWEERFVSNDTLTLAVHNFEKEQKFHVQSRREAAKKEAQLIEKAFEFEAATIDLRLGAAIIDGIVAILTGFLLSWILWIPSETIASILIGESPIWPYVFQFLLGTYISWFIISVCCIASFGQTLGGKICRMEVAMLNGTLPTLPYSLLRVTSQVTTLFSLGVGFLPIWGERKLSLHDFLSTTHPIKERDAIELNLKLPKNAMSESGTYHLDI